MLPNCNFYTSVLHFVQSLKTYSMASNEAASGDDWEKAEGVPNLSEPFIQKYLSGRDALVQQEKRQRSGQSPRET